MVFFPLVLYPVWVLFASTKYLAERNGLQVLIQKSENPFKRVNPELLSFRQKEVGYAAVLANDKRQHTYLKC